MTTLYHEATHTPVTLARLLRDEVLVAAYVKPDMAGHIIIPEVAKGDRTQTLWEVIQSSPAADEAAGMALPAGAIVQTQRRWPRDTHLVTKDGRHAFLLSIDACGLRGVITYAE